jgi:hypothetical protein
MRHRTSNLQNWWYWTLVDTPLGEHPSRYTIFLLSDTTEQSHRRFSLDMFCIWCPHSVSILLRPINCIILANITYFVWQTYLDCWVCLSHVRKSTYENMSSQLFGKIDEWLRVLNYVMQPAKSFCITNSCGMMCRTIESRSG